MLHAVQVFRKIRFVAWTSYPINSQQRVRTYFEYVRLELVIILQPSISRILDNGLGKRKTVCV